MVMFTLNIRKITFFLCSVLFLFLYNEYLIYYVVLLQCSWPQPDPSEADFSIPSGIGEPLKIMVLADTHLLGTREGHWFDKLRRLVLRWS